MNISDVKNFIERQNWICARTFSKTFPHEYILKERLKHGDKKLFIEVIKYIRKRGEEKHFFKKKYIYFYLGDKKYWDNGCSLKDTRILNRANIDNNLVRLQEYL